MCLLHIAAKDTTVRQKGVWQPQKRIASSQQQATIYALIVMQLLLLIVKQNLLNHPCGYVDVLKVRLHT